MLYIATTGYKMVLKSLSYFILAGLCEIGGGYLVWLWMREHKPFWYGISGMLLLAAYGFIPTLQAIGFGRAYAAYGGIFILLSLLWGWKIDKVMPDRFDIAGSLICLFGVLVILLPKR